MKALFMTKSLHFKKLSPDWKGNKLLINICLLYAQPHLRKLV